MQLFNASDLFSEAAINDIIAIADNPDMLRERLIAGKKALIKAYSFTAYGLPKGFRSTSGIIAVNHLSDADAPLIMSYYYELMSNHVDAYPELFVFAKENCFNGVSIPRGLLPILEMESVYAVDRNSLSGSFEAIRAAKKWFRKGGGAKHFLIFPQGTIYDVNRENAGDIENGAFWLAQLLGVPVLPAFIEQPVEGAENRLVFGKPFHVDKSCRDFEAHKQQWLKNVIEAQNALEGLTGVPARHAALDEAHQTRRKPKTP